MKYRLSGITLEEVSVVDRPAAAMAKIALFKRDEMTDKQKAKMKEYMDKGMSEDKAKAMCMKMEDGMDPEELVKRLEELEGQVVDLSKKAEELESLKKAADAAGFDVADGKLAKRAVPEYIEIEGEKIEKSAVPAAILKALAAKDEALKVAKAKEADVALAKRGAEVLPHLAGTDLAKGKLLEAVGDNEELLKSLKAADAAIAKAMEEIGANPMNDEASATFRLNKMASDYAAQNKVPFETAYAEVTKNGEGRRLMDESRAEAK